jgi:hypothetical protein
MNKPLLLDRHDEESPEMYELMSTDVDHVAGAGPTITFTVRPGASSASRDKDENDTN